jgi:hypothetical protein
VSDRERAVSAGVGNVVVGGVSGQLVQAGHIQSVYLASAGPPRTRYLGQVRQLAPDELVDRESELAELARFCTTVDADDSYTWWRAEAWAGKSALMAWFVLNPPPGVRVVSFFVTARFAGHDTRDAFVETVLEQVPC